MISTSYAPEVRIRSVSLEAAVSLKITEADRIVDVVEDRATQAKQADNGGRDLDARRGHIHLLEDRTGRPVDLSVRVRSLGPQPMDGVTEFRLCDQGEVYGYSRDAVEEKFTYQHGDTAMSVYRQFGTGVLTICDE